MRLGLPALVLAGLLAIGVAACSSAPPHVPVAFRETPKPGGVFKVTAQWRGPWPADLQEQMLMRAAEIARRQGAASFMVMSADFDVTNTSFLREYSPTPPVMVVQHEQTPQEAADTSGLTFAAMTIQVYKAGQEPVGYRLYDVAKAEKALAEQSRPASGPNGSMEVGVGVFSSSRGSGMGLGMGVRP